MVFGHEWFVGIVLCLEIVQDGVVSEIIIMINDLKWIGDGLNVLPWRIS